MSRSAHGLIHQKLGNLTPLRSPPYIAATRAVLFCNHSSHSAHTIFPTGISQHSFVPPSPHPNGRPENPLKYCACLLFREIANSDWTVRSIMPAMTAFFQGMYIGPIEYLRALLGRGFHQYFNGVSSLLLWELLLWFTCRISTGFCPAGGKVAFIFIDCVGTSLGL